MSLKFEFSSLINIRQERKFNKSVVARLLEKYKDLDPLVVYSMWHGYLDQNANLKNALGGFRLTELHTSGHADSNTIDRLIHDVRPSVIIRGTFS